MNRALQWVVDVGLLHEHDVTAQRWWKVRPLFWRTPSNVMHRTYRDLITVLTEAAIKDVQAAYVRGIKDGALQMAEFMAQEESDTDPKERYVH